MIFAVLLAAVACWWFYEEDGWRGLLLTAVIASAVLFGLASRADAATVPINGPWWAQRAVDEMRAPVVPDQTLILGPCPGWDPDIISACNFPTPDSPIYIQRRFYSRQLLARELGGRFGTLVMTLGAQKRFAQIIRSRELWAMNVYEGHVFGLHDVFEDAYANCALGIPRRRVTLQDPQGDWIDETTYRPTPLEQRRVCALIDRVGFRRGLRPPRG